MTGLLFDNLEIRQFRTFNYLSIEKLGQVNLIIGKNNVGKSSLLEALWLYANIGSPQVMLDILEERDEVRDHRVAGLRPGGDDGPAVWSLFHGHPSIERVSESIQIGRINSPDSALRVSVEWFTASSFHGEETEPVPVSGPAADPKGKELIPAIVVRIGSVKRILRLDQDFETHCRRWNLQPSSVLDLTTRSTFVGPHGLRPTDLAKLWNGIVLTDLEEDVVESLRVISPEIDDLAIINADAAGRAAVRVRLGEQAEPVPLKSLGDGMNRLFGIGMALVNAKDGLLLVDEVENGLHYSVLPSLWKFILKVARRLNIQVFATTHSYDCIKAFNTVTKGDSSIEGIATRLEVKGGEFRASLFDEDRLTTVMDENIEIR
ncbi:MAG: AAA family ATPase [Candidatus Methylomirabilis sp.]